MISMIFKPKGESEPSHRIDDMPPRSQLFSIPPYGLGTWQVESLYSYIRRLSEAHAIPLSQLKQLILRSSMQSSESPGAPASDIRDWWDGIGGIGRVTGDLVEGLNPLLKLDRTTETTLQFLAGRVSARGLVSTFNRHCPKCESLIRINRQRYRFLIWTLNAVNFCPIHECLLEEDIKSVFYQRAHWRMVRPKEDAGPQEADKAKLTAGLVKESELQRSKLVMKMLESPMFKVGLPTYPKSNVSGFLNHVITLLMGGVATRVANYLQVSKGSLHGWTSGNHLPSFAQVIDIAQAFNCSIESVLAGDASQLPLILPGFSRQSFASPYVVHNVNSQQFRKSLVDFINKEDSLCTPPSLADVARNLQVDRNQIIRIYPDIAKEIIIKFKKWRSDNARLSQSIRHFAYREAAVSIAKTGLTPTRNRVMNLLENVSIFSDKDRKKCQDICEEVRREYAIPSRPRVIKC